MAISQQTVIQTKIHPPVSNLRLVDRDKLISQLVDEKQSKLTLVAAPAGFGKTTFICQLFDCLSSQSACCWYSLDQSDSNPTRFLLHFIASIRTVADGFGNTVLRMMETTIISDISDTLAYLVNDLFDIPNAVNFFIDDYHLSDSEQINHFIELLINLSPDNFRLVLASRMRPNLSLSGLKVHGRLNEISASQLRFDDRETSMFMNDIHELELSSEQLISLHEHSEGWVAGLQLASLSLRDIERRDEFIDSFSGNLRDIAEYLAADVLNQQTERIQEFLLRTAILDRLNVDVCAALTKFDDCQTLLHQLESKNLFVIPLDRDREWYRYHHLFHQFLLGELRKRHPASLVALYQIAATWFEAAGYASEAVDYALLSGDIEKAVQLVESQVEEEMKRGRMPRVNSWVDRIPDDVCISHPKLLFAKSTALYHMNKPDEAEETKNLMRNCKALEHQSIDDLMKRLEGGIAICRDDVDRILPPLSSVEMVSSNFDNGTVCNMRGYALASLGNYKQAIETLNDARHYHRLNGSTFGVVYADCFLGFIDIEKGNLQKCYDRFSEYTEAPDKPGDTYVVPVPAIMRAVILYCWNNIIEASATLTPNLQVLEKVGHIKLLSLGYITLAKINAARGDHVNAMRLFDYLYRINEHRGNPFYRLRSMVECERIAYLVNSNHINEAIDIASDMEIDIDQRDPELPKEWSRITCLNMLTLARLQLACGNESRSIPIIQHLISLCDSAGRVNRKLECLLLLAKANEKTGNEKSAFESLESALTLSIANGMIRAYLDEGVCDLLQRLKRRGLKSNDAQLKVYLDAILRHANETHEDSNERKPTQKLHTLVEPLSEREIAILNLIAKGQSNHVISEGLSISENTVKWHVKNIFEKLSVNKRAAAVVTAQQIGILK